MPINTTHQLNLVTNEVFTNALFKKTLKTKHSLTYNDNCESYPQLSGKFL